MAKAIRRYLASSLISLVACLWALRSLWRQRAALSHRLFWTQLVCLVVTNIVYALIGLVGVVLPVNWNHEFAVVGPLFAGSCGFCEFSSCLLEVNIAVGFAAAAWGNVRVASLAYRLIPACFVCSAIMACVVFTPWWPESFVVTGTAWIIWSIVTLSCCTGTVLIYAASVYKMSTIATVLQRCAMYRMCAYTFCFLATFAPRGLFHLLDTPQVLGRLSIDTHRDVSIAAAELLSLSGLGIVSVYMYSVWKMGRTRVDALCDSRSPVEQRVAMEDFMIAQYFDFSLSFSGAIDDARRSAVMIVANTRSEFNAFDY